MGVNLKVALIILVTLFIFSGTVEAKKPLDPYKVCFRFSTFLIFNMQLISVNDQFIADISCFGNSWVGNELIPAND